MNGKTANTKPHPRWSQPVPEENSLAKRNPQLSKEWHPVKNGSKTPKDVYQNSNKKYWWRCSKGHEWEAAAASRNKDHGCPYCSNLKASDDNNLEKTNPELAKEWHPTKNGDLTPRDVLSGSDRKVWWHCEKGHEWNASIVNRNTGKGCPFCGNKKVCNDNCLTTVNPKLAKEWHPKLNGGRTPNDVVPHSNKKVWWRCKKGHEWKVSVANRSNGCGCPYCANSKVCNDNCLATLNPKLAKEWHPTKNGDRTPKNIVAGSNKQVWWQCKKGHEWFASVVNRNKGMGCPYCSNHKVGDDNCLATVNPKLAREWHPTKNGNRTPKDVLYRSHKRVWWRCKKGHEWTASVENRNNGHGCPCCCTSL